MLSIASYDTTYVDLARAKIDAHVEAFDALKAQAGGAAALPELETAYFNGLVMVLDHYFDHRSRYMELKDGNALNEVRILCNSFMHNDGRLAEDKQIRLDPRKSVLGLKPGDEIALTRDSFVKLADAFVTEIGKKYP
ncbi:MAG: hypothetical protein WDN31_11405 [Hyphomicrobium sp.]